MNLDIAGEFSRVIGGFISWIPNLVKAILILIVGWIIAIILRAIVTGALRAVGLNRRLDESPADSFVRRITSDPSRTIGNFVYWLAWIVTITIVIGALNIPIISQLVLGIYGFIPNIIAAIVILLVAIALSIFASNLISRWMGDTATGKIISTVIPVIIMSVAGFAVLEQLKIATIIISATYIAIIGAVALGFALAFGLGGRDVASRLLEGAYSRGVENMDQIRSDIAKGRERAREDKERLKERYRE